MSEKDNNTNVEKETDKLFDLKVLEVKNTLPEIKLPRPVDPRLPTIPGLVLFVARCRSGKCLDGNSELKLKNGNLVKLRDVKLGDSILTKEGYSTITKKYNQGQKECFTIQTKSTSLTATLDHKIDTQMGLKRLGYILENNIPIQTISGFEEIEISNSVGVLETFDIEVNNKSHTFYANNISVKNSNFIMNYLFSENYLGGKVNVFDVIYYVSPTCRMDKSTQVLFREDLEDKVIVFEDIDNVDAFIQNILDYQESFPVNDEDNPRPLVCIVLDDISGALKRSSATTHLCSRYRHYNIHLIISNQTLRDLPTVCRSMADSVFLAQTTSVMERQKVMEEYGDLYKNKLLPAWDEASAEQYHFAYLKLDELVPKIFKIGPSGCNEIDYNRYDEVMPSDLERKNKKRRGRKKKNNIVIEKNE